MNKSEYYITDLHGNVWSKGKGDKRRLTEAPSASMSDEWAEATAEELDEMKAYLEAASRIKGYRTIKEAEEAAEALITAKVPSLAICRLSDYDEGGQWLKPMRELTDIEGRPTREKQNEKTKRKTRKQGAKK